MSELAKNVMAISLTATFCLFTFIAGLYATVKSYDRPDLRPAWQQAYEYCLWNSDSDKVEECNDALPKLKELSRG